MRPLAEWDETYVAVEVRDADESALLEKKARGRFALNPHGRPDGATKDELAKQVSAFSNAGDGFIVYGITDDNALDEGIPTTIGREPIKDWVEAAIPKLVFPPVTQCIAKLIQAPGHHAPNSGVLVVFVPLSDRRPHWVTNPAEVAYIRAGAHSLPMRPQTLLDLSGRGTASASLIEGLNPVSGPKFPVQAVNTYSIQPLVKLLNGAVCKLWAFELKVVTGRAKIIFPRNVGAKIRNEDHLYVVGTEPLFPGRSTPISSDPFQIQYENSPAGLEIVATLYAGSGQPVQRSFAIQDLDASYDSFNRTNV